MAFAHPEYLISPTDLSNKLGNPNLRIFDVSIALKPAATGYTAVSGIDDYQEQHIPGAAFLDQMGQLSDPDSSLGFTRLPDDQLLKAFGEAGINADSDVVLYCSAHMMWATRAWWLLHFCGHTQVAVLDGGLNAWREAGLATSKEANQFKPETLTTDMRPEKFVDCQAVQDAIGNDQFCTVNALSPAVYAGSGDMHYGRRGHIPASINVFYDSLLNDGSFRSEEEMRSTLTEAGLLDDKSVIAYCGGGISATIDAFSCLMLGKQDIAVYDGSMSEWVRDESLPLTEGESP